VESRDALDIPVGFVPANFSPGFLDHSGPYFLKPVSPGFVVGCRVSAHHMNYRDAAHGGVLATMADVALSWAIYSSEVPHPNVSTISLTTNFLSAARLGDWIEASSVIDRTGKNIAYVHGAIRTSAKLIMTMSGVFNVVRGEPHAVTGSAT
jgi:acyl-coenzyme A thioesterase 13